MAECDWEWGGLVEPTPAPCPTPMLVVIDPTTGQPVNVSIVGQPVEVFGSVFATVPDPMPVEEVSPVSVPGSIAADTSSLEELTGLGLGLLVFLVAVLLVTSWARSRSRE